MLLLRSLLLSLIPSTFLILFVQLSNIEFWAMIVFFFNLIFFLYSLGKRIDIVSIILLFAASQWILGPVIAYHGYDPYFRYNMSVGSDQYFSFILPAFIAFEIGLLIFRNMSENKAYPEFVKMVNWIEQYPYIIYILIGIGFFSTLLMPLVPGVLRFVMFLLSGCLYIGVILYFLSNKAYKWYVLGGLASFLILQSIATGLFHNMILWLLFIYMFVAYYYRTSLRTNLTVVFIGVFSLVIVQSIKGTYRSMVWDNGMKDGKTGVFLTLVEEQASKTEELTTGERISELNVRLNQGWIISRIMMNIPQYNEYLEGYTFSEALDAALLPRFLNRNKALGGSVFTFELLTGLNIDESTSMGPSLIGEAYGNYGPEGGIWTMFIIGLILGGSVFLVMHLSVSYPILFAFIPIIFFQVVKAETDSITVLNHLVKSLVLFIPLSIFLTRKYLR